MHRATPLNTSIRAYTSGGSRSAVDTIDDSKLMQEMGGNFMHNETRNAVEAPQNYGFTSVVMGATKDASGAIQDSAEAVISFMGGNRSFPVAGVMDDRRHRLFNLQQGDSAMFSTVGRKLQLHHSTDGGFWTGPRDKTLRMQLLDEDSTPDQQQQQGGSGGQSPGTRDGSTGGTGQGSSGQQQKGQQPRYKDAQNSYRFVDVTKNTTRISGNESHMMLSDGDSYVHCIGGATYLGGRKDKHTFALVCTEAGPAYNVYARISTRQYELLNADPVVTAAPPPAVDDNAAPRTGCPPGCSPGCGSSEFEYSKSAKLLASLALILGLSLGVNYALIRDAWTAHVSTTLASR